MIVKSGKYQFNLNCNDRIKFNGLCYLILTRRISLGKWATTAAILDIEEAHRLIEEGKLVVLCRNGNHNIIYKVGGKHL